MEIATSRRGDSLGSARTRSHDLNFSHCGTLMARDPKIYGVIVDRAALDGPANHTIKSLFTTIDDTVKIIFQGNGGGGSPPQNRFSSPCSRGACTRRSMQQPSWTSRRAWMSGRSLEPTLRLSCRSLRCQLRFSDSCSTRISMCFPDTSWSSSCFCAKRHSSASRGAARPCLSAYSRSQISRMRCSCGQ